MLSADDAVLCDREPEMPGLRIALDPEAMTGLVRDLIPGASDVEVDYIRYKPGVNCIARFRCSGPGITHGYAKVVRRGDEAKLTKLRRRGSIVVGSLAVTAAHRDPAIVGLEAVDKAGSAPALFDRLGLAHTEDTLLRALAYKPERRLVGRVDDQSNTLGVVKLYSSDAYKRASSVFKWTQDVEEVATPQRIATSRRYRALALSWIDGKPMTLRGPEDGVTVGAVAASFSRIGLKDPIVDYRRGIAASVREDASVLSGVVPELETDMRSLAEHISTRFGSIEPHAAAIHGDFSLDQLVATSEGPAVIDLDSARIAAPDTDLASFIAAFERQRPGAHVHLIEPLLAGFDRAGGIRTADFDAFLGAALINRAIEAFRSERSGWQATVRSLIGTAETIVLS